jgi:hypothetical protein
MKLYQKIKEHVLLREKQKEDRAEILNRNCTIQNKIVYLTEMLIKENE